MAVQPLPQMYRPRRSTFVMQLYIMAVLLLTSRSVQATCHHLNESDSTLTATLARIEIATNSSRPASLALEMRQQFRIIDEEFPWLSQCLGSVDYWKLFTSLSKSPAATRCYRDIALSKPPNDINDDYVRDYYCPRFLNITIPCINQVLVPALADAMGSINGSCCDPMKQQLAGALGGDLVTVVETTLKLTANVICSQRTFKTSTGSLASQTCGYSLMTSFVTDDTLHTILTALQISNLQGCDAMTGRRFHTTQGMPAQIFANDSEAPLGVCYSPVSALLRTIASLPIVKTLILRSTDSLLAMHLSSLFGTGRCLRGSLLVNWLSSESSFPLLSASFADATINLITAFSRTSEWREAVHEMNLTEVEQGEHSRAQRIEDMDRYADTLRRAMTALKARVRGLCVHLPNSFQCAYNGERLAVPFPMTQANISVREADTNFVQLGLLESKSPGSSREVVFTATCLAIASVMLLR